MSLTNTANNNDNWFVAAFKSIGRFIGRTLGFVGKTSFIAFLVIIVMGAFVALNFLGFMGKFDYVVSGRWLTNNFFWH